jgi:hypothetical protein
MRKLFTVLAVSTALGANAQAYSGKPHYKLDARQTQVISLSNLSDGTGCSPGRMEGKIVKREYDDKEATTITGVIIEHKDQSRSYLNLDKVSDDIEMFHLRWILEGLESLLKVGRKASFGVHRCSFGRVLIINSIRSAQ